MPELNVLNVLNVPRSHTRLVLQKDYNGKRHGEPDQWAWQDASMQPRGKTRDDLLADAREHVRLSGGSKFIRGWRVVERTTVETDALVEVLI